MAIDMAGATVRQLLVGAAARLAGAGIAEARREAARIWDDLSAAGASGGWPERDLATEPLQAARFERAIELRAQGMPLAYVIGRWGFRRLTLEITPAVLIPRPETELLVELALERINSGRVADIGTGSGCLALALATEGWFRTVVAVDRSAAALAVARRNAAAARASIELVRGDFGSGLASGAFDLIVSNPPYLSTAEFRSLDRSVREFEPRLALESGLDGLAATRAVLADAARGLSSGGWVVMEIDSSRAVESRRIALGAGFGVVTIHQDLFGRERFLLAQRSNA